MLLSPTEEIVNQLVVSCQDGATPPCPVRKPRRPERGSSADRAQATGQSSICEAYHIIHPDRNRCFQFQELHTSYAAPEVAGCCMEAVAEHIIVNAKP